MTETGFTLIELLIVITIIGILASLLMSNFIGVRQRARDSQRKSDLRQIQSALELWRADQGTYPTGAVITSCGNQLQCTIIGCSTPVTYMQKIPCDPLGTSSSPIPYIFNSDGSLYNIRTCLENTNDSQKDSPNNPIVNPSVSDCASGRVSYTLSPP